MPVIRIPPKSKYAFAIREEQIKQIAERTPCSNAQMQSDSIEWIREFADDYFPQILHLRDRPLVGIRRQQVLRARTAMAELQKIIAAFDPLVEERTCEQLALRSDADPQSPWMLTDDQVSEGKSVFEEAARLLGRLKSAVDNVEVKEGPGAPFEWVPVLFIDMSASCSIG